MPAIAELSKEQAIRVGKALDAAFAFGVLEHANDNPSLQDLKVVEARYWQLVNELKLS